MNLPKRTYYISGTGLSLIGALLFLNVYSGITGFSVFASEIGRGFGFVLSLVVLVSGIALIGLAEHVSVGGLEKRVGKMKRMMQMDLKSGRIGSYQELRQYASKIGADLVEEGDHTKVLVNGKYVTEIPRHKQEARTGTYRKILKKMYEAVA